MTKKTEGATEFRDLFLETERLYAVYRGKRQDSVDVQAEVEENVKRIEAEKARAVAAERERVRQAEQEAEEAYNALVAYQDKVRHETGMLIDLTQREAASGGSTRL